MSVGLNSDNHIPDEFRRDIIKEASISRYLNSNETGEEKSSFWKRLKEKFGHKLDETRHAVASDIRDMAASNKGSVDGRLAIAIVVGMPFLMLSEIAVFSQTLGVWTWALIAGDVAPFATLLYVVKRNQEKSYIEAEMKQGYNVHDISKDVDEYVKLVRPELLSKGDVGLWDSRARNAVGEEKVKEHEENKEKTKTS
ncbi:MAG: hypothetical protein ABSD68_03170 [Candidatus Micrarchaeales archaeon]